MKSLRIQVQAGTWDFFSEENFGGESMRLSAGPYPMLAPEWSKRIAPSCAFSGRAGGITPPSPACRGDREGPLDVTRN